MKQLIIILSFLLTGCATYTDIHGVNQSTSNISKSPPLWIMDIERDVVNPALFYVTYMVKAPPTIPLNMGKFKLDKKKIFKKEMLKIGQEYGYVAFIVLEEHRNMKMLTQDWIAEVKFFKTQAEYDKFQLLNN